MRIGPVRLLSHRRLKARRLELLTKILDERDYWPILRKDVAAARGYILIYTPYFTQKGLERWMPELEPVLKRGVRVIVILGEPENWDQRNDPYLEKSIRTRLNTQSDLIKWLETVGAQVFLRPGIHVEFVLIDEDILWEGSLNFLSHVATRKHVRRSISRAEVNEVKERHNMNNLPGGKDSGNSDGSPLTVMVNRRKQLGLSQTELAREIGVPKATISRLEAGKLSPLQPAFRKVLEAVDLRAVFVPEYLCARVEAYVEELCKVTPPASTSTQQKY